MNILPHIPEKGDYKALVNLSDPDDMKFASGHVGLYKYNEDNDESGMETVYHEWIAESHPQILGLDPSDVKPGAARDFYHSKEHQVADVTRRGNKFTIYHHDGIPDHHIKKLANHLMNTHPILDPTVEIVKETKKEVDNGLGGTYSSWPEEVFTYRGLNQVNSYLRRGHPRNEAFLHIELNRYYIAEEIKKVFLSKRDLTT